MSNQIFRLQEKSGLILYERENYKKHPPLTKYFIVDDGSGKRNHYQDCKTLTEAKREFKKLTEAQCLNNFNQPKKETMNNETKHTAGNWHAEDGQIYAQETGVTLALIPYFEKGNEEQEANQKLIAAAPKLLEWMQHISSELEQGRYLSQFEQTELKQTIYKAIHG